MSNGIVAGKRIAFKIATWHSLLSIMKHLPVLAAAVFFLSGCNDTVEKLASLKKPKLSEGTNDAENKLDSLSPVETPNAVAPRDSEVEIASAPFPRERTLTDAMGRSIEARIHAKRGNRIAITKLPSEKHFVLTLDQLGEADRLSLADVPDGGDFDSFESAEVKSSLPRGRKAIWHSHLDNAEKEAVKFGIPLLIAVLINGDSNSEQMEKDLVYSREFKKWADQNVSLCMIQTDGFTGGESTEDTFKNWLSLQRFGIAQSDSSSLVLVDAKKFTSTKLAEGGGSVSKTIKTAEEAIERCSSWPTIAAAPTPIPKKHTPRIRVMASGST